MRKIIILIILFFLSVHVVHAGWYIEVKQGELLQCTEEPALGGSGLMAPQMKSTSSPYSAVTTRTHAKDLYLPYGSATTSDFSVIGLASCDTIDTDANGFFSCGTDADSGAGSAFAWTPSTNYGLTVNATTTGIWFQGIVAASSTSYFENASTSQLTVDQDAWFAITGGSVGIGTTSPAKLLSVHGDSIFSGTLDIGGAINATSTLTVGGKTVLANASSTDFSASGTGWFTLGLGVGTSSPSKLLGVHGNSIISGSLDIGGAITATSTLTVSGLTTLGNASTTQTSATTFFGALVGNADTATALAANGGNCSAGEYALGVDASGAIENCTDATTEINSVVNGLGGTNLTCSGQSCSVDDPLSVTNLTATAASTTDLTVADMSWFDGGFLSTASSTVHATLYADAFSGPLTGNASTASALAADPADCAANTFADAINASGTLTCNAVASADITADTITHANILDSDQADTKCIWFEDPTAADDFNSIWANKTANSLTLTELWAESDQTVTFMLQVDDGSPADIDSVDLAPAAGEAEDTSLDGDTTLAAGEELDLDLVSVSGTPTWVSICWTFNWDD